MEKIIVKNQEKKAICLYNIEDLQLFLESDSSVEIVYCLNDKSLFSGDSLNSISNDLSLEKKLKIDCEISGNGARLNVLILQDFTHYTNLNEKLNIWSRCIISGDNNSANFTVKSVLNNSAEVAYKGDLIINKDSKGIDTFLRHNSRLLSDGAKATTTPALEIMAKDVKAGHAATIGRLDKEDLFYLMARGISKPDAELLLANAFLNSAVDQIEDYEIKESVRNKININ